MQPEPQCDFCCTHFLDGEKLWVHYAQPFVLEALVFNRETKETLDIIEYIDDDAGAWAACQACHALIEKEDFSALLDRAVDRELAQSPNEDREDLRNWLLPLQRQFWNGKTGLVVEETAHAAHAL